MHIKVFRTVAYIMCARFIKIAIDSPNGHTELEFNLNDVFLVPIASVMNAYFASILTN